MADIIIFGAGDTARLAHVYFTRDSDHTVAAFTVDAANRRSKRFVGLPLVDFETVAITYPPGRYQMFIAMGPAQMNRARAETYYRAGKLGYEFVSYVSTRCTLLTDQPVGANCFILEQNIIQPFAKIGNNVTLWSGNHIGHDAIVENHCFISSHVVVSGRVRVGQYSLLESNCTIRNGVTIAPETLVSAGAVITHDTVERGVYVPGNQEPLAMRSDEVEE